MAKMSNIVKRCWWGMDWWWKQMLTMSRESLEIPLFWLDFPLLRKEGNGLTKVLVETSHSSSPAWSLLRLRDGQHMSMIEIHIRLTVGGMVRHSGREGCCEPLTSDYSCRIHLTGDPVPKRYGFCHLRIRLTSDPVHSAYNMAQISVPDENHLNLSRYATKSSQMISGFLVKS